MKTFGGSRVRIAPLLFAVGLSACPQSVPDVGDPATVVASPPGIATGSGRSGEALIFVSEFMDRRVAGRGARRFLEAEGLRAYRHIGGDLAPLYPKPPLRDFEIVFVDDLGDGTYEVGVQLEFRKGSYGETVFVRFNDVRWVVSGGRPGLEGP